MGCFSRSLFVLIAVCIQTPPEIASPAQRLPRGGVFLCAPPPPTPLPPPPPPPRGGLLFPSAPRRAARLAPDASHAEAFLLACQEALHSDASGATALASNWPRSRFLLVSAQSGSCVKGWRT